MPFVLSPQNERELQEIFSRYPNKQAALIPVLHLCQKQHGWINQDVIDFAAARCEQTPAHVKGVVTFYSLFQTHPVGKHQIWVCHTLSCALRGSDSVLKHCIGRLGIHPGETTPDGSVTLHTAECLAACGQGPMMQVDDTYYERVTLEQVDQILDGLTRGMP